MNLDKSDLSLSLKYRVKGAIWGLAAGDRNGGPIRMSLRLANSLLTQKNYDRKHLIEVFYNWQRGPPYDTERSFDTGPTFNQVFNHYQKGIPIEQAAQLVNSSSQNVGINSAHRVAPLACFGTISDGDLVSYSQSQCMITHLHPISVEITNVFSILLRKLILGFPLEVSITEAKKYLTSYEGKLAFNPVEYNQLSPNGFAPNVLQATLYFLSSSSDFSTTLQNSIDFAGSANYCPVLVGALTGALYGVNEIKPKDFDHCDESLRKSIETIAEALSESWTITEKKSSIY